MTVSGKTVSRYEVPGQRGGGMGVVYRARDTRSGRRLLLFLLVCVVSRAAIAQEFSVETTTDSGRLLFEEARTAVHETRYELADDLLRAVVKEDLEFALGWSYLAVVDLLLFRDPSESIAKARKQVEGLSKRERQMTEILIRFASNDLERCESLILDFLDMFPKDRFARHILGMVYSDLGFYEDGIAVLRELIRMHPDYVPAWNHLGNIFMDAGDMPKAKAALTMFLELSIDNPGAYDSYAEFLARDGKIDEAVSHLRRALEIEPRMAFAWMHMGDILIDADLTEEAESAYRFAGDASLLYGDDFRAVLDEKIRSTMVYE